MHAEWVDREQERAAPIVERVQEDLDFVVGVDVVAVGERRAYDAAVRLVRANPEVNRVRSVEREHVRAVLRRPAIDGAVLRETGQQRGLLPRRFVEHTVDVHGGRLDTGYLHLDLMQAAVVYRMRIARGLEEEEKNGKHEGLKYIAECGLRNAECQMIVTIRRSHSSNQLSQFRNPQSAFRNLFVPQRYNRIQ